MGEDNFNNVTSLFLSTPEGKLCSLGQVKSFNITESEEPTNAPISLSREIKFGCSFEPTPEQEFLFKNISYSPCVRRMAKIGTPCGSVPTRHNKRKRIQKKWNKRYGMKTIYKYRDIEFDHESIVNNPDGTFIYELSSPNTTIYSI